jgi:hypothetical protein
MGREIPPGASRIHHHQFHPGRAGQHVHPGPAGQEVGHHLPGDLLGKGAHAFFRDPVVPGEGVNAGRVHRRRLASRNAKQTGRRLLKPPQAAARFGQAVQTGLGLFTERSVNRRDRGQGAGKDIGHDALLHEW